eukprot:86987_1
MSHPAMRSLSSIPLHASTKDMVDQTKSNTEKITELGWCPRPSAFFSGCCYALPIFHPYGLLRLCWDVFILLALIYTATEIPLTLAFEVTLVLNKPLGMLALAIDIVLLLDVAVNFRTRYYDKWDRLLLHTDPFDIARKYFRGWFLLDLITSFPFQFIITQDKSTNFGVLLKVLRVFRLFRIFKILRVIRVMKMFDGLTKMMDIAREVFFVLKLSKIMGAMVLTAHYFACIWWWVGVTAYREGVPVEVNEDGVTIYSSWIQAKGIEMDDSLFVKYSASWYWAIVTLFTTGYGDITAHNPTEQWVCSICILAGSCFFAYFIGTLTSWVAEGDRVRSFEIQKVEEAQAFCRHHKFSRELTRMVLTHVRYYCNYNFVFESEDVLSVLPPFLQRKVNTGVAERYLSKMDLFKHLPPEVIGQIALTMHSVSCNANRYLYNRGDVALCIYIQRTGEAKLRYSDGTSSRRLHRGDVLGERALISGKRRDAVKVIVWSEFFVLDIESIRNVFRNNFKPKRFKHEWNALKRKVKMDQSRHVKAARRVRMSTSPNNVTRQTIHQVSEQADTIRSDFLDIFRSVESTPKYAKVNVDDDDETDTPMGMNIDNKPWLQSCALDLDDTIYLPNEESKQDRAKKSQSDLSKYSHNNHGHRSIFSNIYPFKFNVRQNSERRNKKVMCDTATTAFGKKVADGPSPHPNKSTDDMFGFDEVLSDQMDMDESTDDDGVLRGVLEHTATKRVKSSHSQMSKKGMGKFGTRKGKRNIVKSRRKGMSSVRTLNVTKENKEEIEALNRDKIKGRTSSFELAHILSNSSDACVSDVKELDQTETNDAPSPKTEEIDNTNKKVNDINRNDMGSNKTEEQGNIT